ncbi:MAG: sigma 54-interacting transcriptional regulator [Deltaproteobacteria bacterium]|nr:sigma 54-interacting transcriptional regulator [Deltaproteobacteria bacterium]
MLLAPDQRTLAAALARLHRVNPFTPERDVVESAALGQRARRGDNQAALEELTVDLAEHMARQLARGQRPVDDEREIYREVVLLTLFDRCALALDDLIDGKQKKATCYAGFLADWRRFFSADDVVDAGSLLETPARLFALFFQLRRAYHFVFRFILGPSAPTAALRASIWRSIFTVDPARYRRALVGRMHEVPTLILGETGTGKELVARAIAFSAFVPFVDDKQSFVGDWTAFFPISLAELPDTLVESTLFGHVRGAFTGAVDAREGVFAACPPEGTVFLDEIGDLPALVQVKLLRVLETRELSPLGSIERLRFKGKLVAATHRDLGGGGGFRADLFHRLAGDVVRTPPLRERRDDDDSEVDALVAFLCEQAVGAREAPGLARDVDAAIASLGKGYAWPGNVRELAQLVRRVLVQGAGAQPTSPAAALPSVWWDQLKAGSLSLDDVVAGYVQLVHARQGSVSATARALGVDRRTVRARLSPGDSALDAE